MSGVLECFARGWGVLWKSSHGHGYTYSVLDMSQPDLDEIALYNMYTLDPLDLLNT